MGSLLVVPVRAVDVIVGALLADRLEIQAFTANEPRILGAPAGLADETGQRSDQETDARTVMAVMNVEDLAPEVYSCAELLGRTFVEQVRLMRCDEFTAIPSDRVRSVGATAGSPRGQSYPLLRVARRWRGSGVRHRHGQHRDRGPL